MEKITIENVFDTIFEVSEQLKKMQYASNELSRFFEQNYETEKDKALFVLGMFEKNSVVADILADYLHNVTKIVSGLLAHEEEFTKSGSIK